MLRKLRLRALGLEVKIEVQGSARFQGKHRYRVNLNYILGDCTFN